MSMGPAQVTEDYIDLTSSKYKKIPLNLVMVIVALIAIVFHPVSLIIFKDGDFRPLEFNVGALALTGVVSAVIWYELTFVARRRGTWSTVRQILIFGLNSLLVTLLAVAAIYVITPPGDYELRPHLLAYFLLSCWGLQTLVYILRSTRYDANTDQVQAYTESQVGLSRVLHNTFQPQVLAVVMELRLAAEDTADAVAAEVMTDAAGKLVTLNNDRVRALSRSLNPTISLLNLKDSLEVLLATFSGIPLTADIDDFSTLDFSEGFGSKVSKCVYRCVEQSLVNIVAHAKSAPTLVRAQVVDSAISVTITDTGPGLTPGLTPGLGLAIIKEAVQDVKGANYTLLNRSEGPGTVFNLLVPYRTK